jgi:hypothetical protein
MILFPSVAEPADPSASLRGVRCRAAKLNGF